MNSRTPPEYSQPAHAPPQSSGKKALVLGVAALGVFVFLLCTLLFIAGVVWVVRNASKADPIPGITIVVDTGNAIDKKGTDHAAHAYLNRRLRELGYDQPGVGPLRVEVKFLKVGEVAYQVADRQVVAEEVELRLEFIDQNGRHLKTVTSPPKMHQTESFKYDAAIELNKAAYGRAVSQILHVQLPRPDEL